MYIRIMNNVPINCAGEVNILGICNICGIYAFL